MEKTVNPSTLQPLGRSLLRVDTERRLFPHPEGWGLGAVERVKVLNELAKRGIIQKYAIGGGVGLHHYYG